MVKQTQPTPGYNVNRSIGWNIEQAQVNITQIITDGADCYPWREVFALWPVRTISGKYVWWKKLYKRKVWVVWGTGFHMEPCVHYATAFDLLNDPYQEMIYSTPWRG